MFWHELNAGFAGRQALRARRRLGPTASGSSLSIPHPVPRVGSMACGEWSPSMGPRGAGKSTVARRLAERLGWRVSRHRCHVSRRHPRRTPRRESTSTRPGPWETWPTARRQLPHGRVILDRRGRHHGDPSARGDQGLRRRGRQPERPAAGWPAGSGISPPMPDTVTEGRDQGTIVFPDAFRKFFLTAAEAERARRRLAELRPGARRRASSRSSPTSGSAIGATPRATSPR